MKRIVIVATGGHTLAALATVQELRRKANWRVFWIGATAAIESSGVPTLEEQILPGEDISFFRLNTGKIHRRKIWKTPLSLLRLPLGFLQALWLMLRTRPAVILSFGGFISAPVAFAGWLLRTPIIVHEQTSTSGLTNRLVARIATKVAISSKLSAPDFPKKKVVLTGNPVREAIWKIAEDRRSQFARASRGKQRGVVIYITGGSRGSQIINKAVFEVLPRLLELGEVYHQTGVLDYGLAQEKAKELDKSSSRYHMFANVSPQQAEEFYRRADLIVSRAGANTVSELEVLGIPAILIPIPWAEHDEQTKNAQVLVERGNGVLLPQDLLAGAILLKRCKEILRHPAKYKAKGSYRLVHPEAAKRLVELVNSIVR